MCICEGSACGKSLPVCVGVGEGGGGEGRGEYVYVRGSAYMYFIMCQLFSPRAHKNGRLEEERVNSVNFKPGGIIEAY